MSVALSARDHDLRETVQNLAEQIVEGADFCWVYEDPELEDLPHEEQLEIFDLLQSARVTLSWDHLE